ncbi:MAG: aspartate-semialdehyde dehydrogenase [Nitriliruptorales bacterium]|nr:aspartate-semialdehyde dehydrogenase [Nitriliruptorales bacterium]
MRVAVVGATGAVGRDLRRLLEERTFPCDEVVLVASERSAGGVLPFRGRDQVIRALTDRDVFDGVDLALFSAGGSTSREHAPRAVEAGALVVDNSSAWRMDDEVPLVVVEVNPDTVGTPHRPPPKGIIANPNCTTMTAMLPLKALHDAFDLVGFTATSFQAAGGAGQKGIDELAAQIEPLFAAGDLLRSDGRSAAKLVEHHVHEATLAFNVVPLLGAEAADGYTDEELKLVNESRKILGLPDLVVTPTCVRVPVTVGHSIAISATFQRQVTAAAALSRMEGFPGLVVEHVPTPLEFAGRDEVAVGRVRADLFDPHVLNFFVVGDNLLKGAALNTVQIAELLLARGLITAKQR